MKRYDAVTVITQAQFDGAVSVLDLLGACKERLGAQLREAGATQNFTLTTWRFSEIRAVAAKRSLRDRLFRRHPTRELEFKGVNVRATGWGPG